jgi:DNA-binding response OmpR family regulator
MSTVLLFSDSQATTTFTMTCLLDSRFQATHAFDLEDALKLLTLRPFDLVVADLHLHPDYAELIASLRPVPSLLLVDRAHEQAAQASGANQVLSRPFLPCELLAAIHRQVG